MGKNTGDGTRIGCVKNRSQFYNQQTEMWMKRDDTTGKIVSGSKNSYKGVKTIAPKLLTKDTNKTKRTISKNTIKKKPQK